MGRRAWSHTRVHQTRQADPNYRVGVISTDYYYGGGFGQRGFKVEFFDTTTGSENQVRHFVGWFGAGYTFSDYEIVRNLLYRAEGTNDSNNADVALGLAAIQIGASFGGP